MFFSQIIAKEYETSHACHDLQKLLSVWRRKCAQRISFSKQKKTRERSEREVTTSKIVLYFFCSTFMLDLRR